jgi:integrase
MRGHVRKYELKDGTKRWAAVVYQGKRVASTGKLQDSYRWIRGFQTQKAAQSQLTKVLKSVGDGTYTEPSKQTLGEFLGRWLNTVQANLAPRTFERYNQLVEVNIIPKLGAILLTQLQPVQIAEFYTWAGTAGKLRTNSGLNIRTVLHIHRLLRQALQQAVLWQLRPTNPADLVDAPRPPEIEMKPVDEDRAGFLILLSEGTRLFLPILTALCTGMRRGEILGIRWSDLDFENSRVTVNQSVSETRKDGVFFKSPKRKKSRRTITLPAILIAAIREQQKHQQEFKNMFGPDYKDFDLVMPNPDGTPWAPDRFSRIYKDFVKTRGAGDIRFHDLRHTHASELLRRGTPLKTVSERLGHANATITLNTYAHVMNGDDEKASDLVGDFLEKQLTKQRKKDNK